MPQSKSSNNGAEAISSIVWEEQLSSSEEKLPVHNPHRGELSAMMTSVKQLECVMHARDSHDV